jgi:hypothetical protein
MTSSQTFSDDMTKMAIYTSLIIGTGSAILFLILRVPSILILAIAGGLTLLYALVMLVGFSFMKTHTVRCDSSACEVVTKSWWRHFGSKRFRWDDVQATRIVVQVHQGLTNNTRNWISIHLFVVVNGNEVEMLRKQNLSKSFSALVATVNEFTPHLAYAWVKPKEVNEHRVLENTRYYYKVARRQIG